MFKNKISSKDLISCVVLSFILTSLDQNKYIVTARDFFMEKAISNSCADPVEASILFRKLGGKIINITFVRGKYDFIAEFELPNFEAAAALKMITMSSGGFSEMEIMEPVDLNQIAKSAFSAAGEYKAVGK